jgi:hypothetical protein
LCCYKRILETEKFINHRDMGFTILEDENSTVKGPIFGKGLLARLFEHAKQKGKRGQTHIFYKEGTVEIINLLLP